MTDNTAKHSVLISFSRSPYSSSVSRSGVDLALAAAAFDQNPTVLFLGAGVLQLLPNQGTEHYGIKNLGRAIAAMPLYDIETLYVDAGALISRGLGNADLVGNTVALNAAEIRELMNRHTHLLSF